MNFKLSFSIIFIASTINSFAQNREVLNQLQAKYSDSKALFVNRTGVFTLNIENKNLTCLFNAEEQIFISNEAGLKYQNRQLATSNFIEASKLKANIQLPKGNKYERKEVEKFDLKANPDRSNFYDDQKVYSFTYPSAQVGSLLNFSYQLEYKEPRFVGSYFWANYIPTINDELKIIVQKGINIQYKTFHFDNYAFDFKKEENKNETVYTWKITEKKPISFYSDAPDFRYYEPHLIFYITDYTIDGQKKELLNTPRELYKWYSAIQANLNKTEDKNLKHTVDSLIAGVSSEKEKVKNIFYWVQKNISYVAFEDGLGGFVPRDAGLVCSRKFGDCKDMASILNEMMRMAGIKSYLTWIGSRDIPYTYNEVPTPNVDNHMIASYLDEKNNWVFLDATGKNGAYDLPTSFIQGKQALIGISKDSFRIETVPIKDTAVNFSVDSVFIKIDGNIIKGKGRAAMYGYDATDYLLRTENKNSDEAKNFFRSYFEKGNNKIEFFGIEKKREFKGPLQFNYEFNLPDYARVAGSEMYINLNIDRGLIPEKIETDRKIPVAIKHKTLKKIILELEIPEGYKLSYLPSNSQLTNDLCGFTTRYSQKGNKIYYYSDYFINKLMVTPVEFEKYNSVIKEQIKSYSNSMVLIKK